MGRSAKFAKRPTKAEKVARQINKPIQQRDLSPRLEQEEEPEKRSEIPLFNTSAKGRQYSTKPDPRKVTTTTMVDDDDDDEAPELVDADADELSQIMGNSSSRNKLKRDKFKQANQSLDKDRTRVERKLGEKYKKGSINKTPILNGKDYVKMLESRPGGNFKHKKLR